MSAGREPARAMGGLLVGPRSQQTPYPFAPDFCLLAKGAPGHGIGHGRLQLRRHALGHPGAHYQRLDRWIKDVTGSLVAAFYLAAVLVVAGAAAMVVAREPGQD